MRRSRGSSKGFVLVIGIIGMVYGIFLLIGSFTKLQTYEKAYATVVDTRTYTTHSRRVRTHKYVTLRFEDKDGKEHGGQIEYSGATKQKGNIMVVYYDPKDPIRFVSKDSMWKEPIALLLCGALCVGAVLYFGDRIG